MQLMNRCLKALSQPEIARKQSKTKVYIIEGVQSQGHKSERKKEVNHARREHKYKRVCNKASYSFAQSLRICPQAEITDPCQKLAFSELEMKNK